MFVKSVLALAGLAITTSANAQSELEAGFAGAIRGCEEWVLNPASWTEGTGPFVSAVGLGDQMDLVESVDETALPPMELRVANHYWRINSTSDAGYILIVSDQLPMCHITGGGGSDLQPIVETVLDSPEFLNRWEEVEKTTQGQRVSTRYRSREEPAFSLLVSRADEPRGRLDRVQVLATAVIDMNG